MKLGYGYFPETKLWVKKLSQEEGEIGQTALLLKCPCCRSFVAVSGDVDSQNLESIYVNDHIDNNKKQEQTCFGSGKTFLQFKEWIEDKPESDLEKITGDKYIWYIRLKKDEPETRTITKQVNNRKS